MLSDQNISNTINRIDAETQGFCVYPAGMNADCIDCTNCRRAFLDKIRHTLINGGSARLLVIDNGVLMNDTEIHN